MQSSGNGVASNSQDDEIPLSEINVLAGHVADAVMLQLHNRLKRMEDNLALLVDRTPPEAVERSEAEGDAAEVRAEATRLASSGATAPGAVAEAPAAELGSPQRDYMDDLLADQDRLVLDAQQSLNSHLQTRKGRESPVQPARLSGEAATRPPGARTNSKGRSAAKGSGPQAGAKPAVGQLTFDVDGLGPQAPPAGQQLARKLAYEQAEQGADQAELVVPVATVSASKESRASKMQKVEKHKGRQSAQRDIGPRAALPSWVRKLQEPDRTGYLAEVLAGKWFDRLSLLIIVANMYVAVWSADLTALVGEQDLPKWFTTADLFFTGYFVMELLLKLWVHRLYFFTNEDWAWNWFDTFIVVMAVVEIALTRFTQMGVDLTFARVCRMLRVQKSFRALKAVRFLTEFRLMINCVLGSMVPLLWTTVLLFSFIAVFSLVFLQATTEYMLDHRDDIDQHTRHMLEKHFSSVSAAMVSLLACVTGGEDWSRMYDLLARTGWAYALVFLFFVVFFLMSFFNITTSLFVDQALKLSRPDHEARMLEKWREDITASADLRAMISHMDKDKSGKVNRAEWMRMVEEPDVVAHFELADLDIKDANDFFDAVVSLTGNDEIDIETFVESCMKVKGAASSIDLQIVLFQVRAMRQMLDNLMKVE